LERVPSCIADYFSAVGSIAIQLAKHVIGAKRVVGIAGGKDKCDWVVNELGADACVDYKAGGDLKAEIKKALGGQFADRYFDNVGGDILNTMFTLVSRHGKIGVCGMISGYMGAKPDFSNLSQIISNRIQVEGE
jgi:NADPH-dependent curcumin reductase CurA